MNTLPEPLKKIVDQLAKLPGLGPKSAMRLAMTLLKWPESETRRLGQGIHDLRDNLHLCSECGSLADTPICHICSNPERAIDVLCIVSEWDSLLALEEGGFYKGRYLILGGLLAPLENIQAHNLEFDKLFQKLQQGAIQEIILALGATIEAETTASYIKNALASKFPNIHISRLAQGIPLGSEVKFMDRETLRQSMKFRQNL